MGLCLNSHTQAPWANVQGRLPNDQGFDEWWGILNSWDEAGYTAWSLFPETGVPDLGGKEG